MTNIPEQNESIANAGLGNTGVRRSAKAGAAVDTAALAEALERSNQLNQQLLEQNKRLEAEIQSQKSNQNNNNGINQLVDLLSQAIKPVQQGPTATDEINRSVDFKNSRATVDGRSLAETQAQLQGFRQEPTKPISIPRRMADAVGPNLIVTVNGIRVAIPCDGKTYMINETHWQHAKERLAKLDIQEAKDNDYVTME